MFLIENGRLGRAVKGLRVSNNIIQMLQSIRGISKDQKWIRWWEASIPTFQGHFLIDQVGGNQVYELADCLTAAQRALLKSPLLVPSQLAG